jgi:hypothetical protein
MLTAHLYGKGNLDIGKFVNLFLMGWLNWAKPGQFTVGCPIFRCLI